MNKYLIKIVFCGVLISFSTAIAQTEIEGEVSGEWNAEGSPYIVLDSTWVPEGEELTILEGVTVRFAAETGLYVYGMVTAIGTEEDSIHFTTNEEGEEWAGIHFYLPEEEYQFEYCTVRNAYNGLVTRWHIYLNVIHCDINCTYIAFGTLDINENRHVGNRYYFEDSIIIGSRSTYLSRDRLTGLKCYFSTGGGEEGRNNEDNWGLYNLGSVELTDCDFFGTLGSTLSGVYRNCNIYSPNDLPINVWIVGGGALIQDCYVEGRVEVSTNRSDIVGNEILGKLNIHSYTGLISDNVIGKMRIRQSLEAITITNCIFNENVSIYDGPEVEMYNCHLLGNVDPWINTLYLLGLDNRETPVHFIHHNLIFGRVRFTGNYLDVVMANNTIIAESLDDPLISTTLQDGTIQVTNNIMICEGENDGLYYPILEPGLNAIINYNLIYGFAQFVFPGPLVEDVEMDETNLFDVDPLLVSLDPLDPRPTPDSPCVDAGDPDSPLDPDSTRADIGMIYYHHVVSVPDRRMVVLPTTEMLSIYPNPFNGVSTFAFSLGQPGAVRIDIFNTLGKRQVELVSGNYATGIHNVSWDGSGLPSGEYIVKMTAGEQVTSRKVMMIK